MKRVVSVPFRGFVIHNNNRPLQQKQGGIYMVSVPFRGFVIHNRR